MHARTEHACRQSTGSKTLRAAALLAALAALFSAPAAAQCPGEWLATDGVSGGATPSVGALVTWDPDGASPQQPVLVVGGSFDTAGTTPANNIAILDGTTWSALGAGTNGDINALAVLPSGQLVAAGLFTTAGDAVVSNIATWDGTAWHALGAGISGEVYALTLLPSGDLVAGGNFITAGELPAHNVARWNGAAWSAFGTGVGGPVYSLTVMTNGELVAGGNFLMAGSNIVRHVARWRDGVWQGIAGGMNAAVLAVAGMPNGDLIASGIFTQRIGRYDGTAWNTLAGGLNAQALVILPRNNTEFIAGGHFFLAGGVGASKIARWDGDTWHPLGTGLDQYVIALAVTPKGDLAVGGGFTTASDLPSPGLALWTIPGMPEITRQPQSLTTCWWGDATFTAAATGDNPLYWRWQAELDPGVWSDLIDGDLLHNGTRIAIITGAAGETLQLTTLADFTDDRPQLALRCVASNICGRATTTTVSLTVRPACIGDASCDGGVSLTDLAILLANYGTPTGATPAQGDWDADQDVDLSDLARVLAMFGSVCP